MDNSIKAVFESLLGSLVIDSRFAKQLHLYQLNFVNKNEDHIAFFGGNLMGVNPIRFTQSDRDNWFDDIVQCQEWELEARLRDLPTIHEDRKVTSDTMNLSCAYLMHAIYNSKLSHSEKETALIDVMLVMQYKFLTSLLFPRFRYPAPKEIAEATYAQLSNKFAIRRLGSWGAVLKARAEDTISDSGIHLSTIKSMDQDEGVTYLISDTQSRIRDMVKNIYDVHVRVDKQGVKIASTSSLIEHDGEQILKDKTKSLLVYSRYLKTVVADKYSFIRDDLCQVIERTMPTMPPRLFRQTLEWMSDNYQRTGTDQIDSIINDALTHSFGYMAPEKASMRNTADLPGLITKLKGAYGSSRSTDPILFQLRERTEKMVRLATHNRNDGIVSSVRTAVLLYIVVRALTMKHYTASIA